MRAFIHGGRRVGFLFALLVVLLAAFSAPLYASYFAVIVGVADYPGVVNDLEYTDDDAIDLYHALMEDSGRWSAGRMQLLLDAQASKDGIREAIERAASEGQEGDVFLFFFSGHGTIGPDRAPLEEADHYDEYLCSYGSEPEAFVRDDELSDWLSLLPMGRIVVLLDTCFSGGQIRSAGGGRVVKGLGSGPRPGRDDGFIADLIGRYGGGTGPLDLDDLGGRIVALTSSRDDELSWEYGEPIAHGLFSYFLLEGLRGPADEEANRDGDVTAEELFPYVYLRVVETAEGDGVSQHPTFLDGDPAPLVVRSWGPPPVDDGDCCELEPVGWNLVSPPIDPDDPDPEVVFDEVTGTLYLYWYDPETESWHTVENGLLTGVGALGGYWLWVTDVAEFCVEGVALEGDRDLQLGAAGWQMIGVPYEVAWGPADGGSIEVTRGAETLSLADAVAAGWIYFIIWEYDPVTEAWIKPTIDTGRTLEPCVGYWIFTYFDDLVLTFKEEEAGPPGGPPVPTSLPKGLEVKGDPPMPTLPIGVAKGSLEFGNYPNPITDVNTTTFRVKSALPVETLRVEIYDMAGRLVYEDEGSGSELVWHTENELGEYLANGVYLYRLYALVDGEWALSEVKKLAIYR